MIKLYNFPASGNCHKVRLLLSLLNLPHEVVPVAGAKAEHKSPGFLAMNPFGQVPVLEDGEVVLRDSQAILYYLAQRYGEGRWMPNDVAEAAQVMAWLSVASSEVSRGPGMLRLHHKFGRPIDVAQSQRVTSELLDILDAHLSHQQWLVGAQVSIADIAVYPYIALAPEGQVDLSPHPHVLDWLRRIRSTFDPVGMPGMITFQESA